VPRAPALPLTAEKGGDSTFFGAVRFAGSGTGVMFMIETGQLVRYLAVGGVVTLVDIAVFGALTGGQWRVPRIRANVVSVTIGMALGFSLHFMLVFHPVDARMPVRLMRYLVTVGASVYGVQNLVISVLSERWLGPARLAQVMAHRLDLSARYSDDFIDRMIGKVAATLAGMVWNFLFFKYFVYA